MSISQPIQPIVHPEPTLSLRRTRLTIVAMSHTAIDFFSFTVPPLLSVLEGHLSLSPGQGAFLLGIGSLCNGLVQPLVAWLSDKADTRLFGWLGLLMAIIGVGFIGYARTYEQLLAIQIMSSVGIGAFHPIAAAAMGSLSGKRRSFGVATFYCAGMAGGIAGNITAPLWVSHFGGESLGEGLRSIAKLIPPGLVFVVALCWAIHRVSHRHAGARDAHAALGTAERRSRWRAVWVLYAGNVIRFTVDTALILLIVRWTEQLAMTQSGSTELTDSLRQEAARMSGPLQAAKQVGMGVCGLLAGWWIGPRHEKLALVVSPIIGAAALLVMPMCTGAWAMVACMVAGIGYGGLVPVTISLAQRLLPHRTSLASGLMMGGAWAVASLGAPLAQWSLERFGIRLAFAVVAGVSVLAAATTAFLSQRQIRAVGSLAEKK
ncbi:MAG: MFS transporter [Pyrinomonadaceae bacterium]|nr:MFS transporter [Phycisphaerales bacterium]